MNFIGCFILTILLLFIVILQYIRITGYENELLTLITIIICMVGAFIGYVIIIPLFFTFAVETVPERGFTLLAILHWVGAFGLTYLVRDVFSYHSAPGGRQKLVFYIFVFYLVIAALVL